MRKLQAVNSLASFTPPLSPYFLFTEVGFDIIVHDGHHYVTTDTSGRTRKSQQQPNERYVSTVWKNNQKEEQIQSSTQCFTYNNIWFIQKTKVKKWVSTITAKMLLILTTVRSEHALWPECEENWSQWPYFLYLVLHVHRQREIIRKKSSNNPGVRSWDTLEFVSMYFLCLNYSTDR